MAINISQWVAEARKFQVGALGIVLQIISLGVLSGQNLHIAQVVASVLTAIGVYLVPNGQTTPKSTSDVGPGFIEGPSPDPSRITP